MTRPKCWELVIAIALSAGFAGCAEATCEKICDACSGYGDCMDECKDEYNDGDSSCKSKMRDFADCVDDNGCDLSCAGEVDNVLDECNFSFF